MPLYEYRCKDCDEMFEKMIRWSETSLSPECPNCQSLNTQKKMSHIAAIGSSIKANPGSGSSCGSNGRFS
jgi:putative FmdB family regulatory protein